MDGLFAFEAPAAKVMPPGPAGGGPMPGGAPVLCGRLVADWEGWAARVNAGVCVLQPNVLLLDYIVEQVEPLRYLEWVDDAGPDGAVGNVFGAPWR
eukprot:4296786-Alexandrium_andersonii.AAC.1